MGALRIGPTPLDGESLSVIRNNFRRPCGSSAAFALTLGSRACSASSSHRMRRSTRNIRERSQPIQIALTLKPKFEPGPLNAHFAGPSDRSARIAISLVLSDSVLVSIATRQLQLCALSRLFNFTT